MALVNKIIYSYIQKLCTIMYDNKLCTLPWHITHMLHCQFTTQSQISSVTIHLTPCPSLPHPHSPSGSHDTVVCIYGFLLVCSFIALSFITHMWVKSHGSCPFQSDLLCRLSTFDFSFLRTTLSTLCGPLPSSAAPGVLEVARNQHLLSLFLSGHLTDGVYKWERLP